MLEQTISWTDLPKVVVLSFLEIILSVDNVVVLALLISRLPEKLHKKAFLIGSLSAIVIRIFAIGLISLLIDYPWVQVFAALYLLYIAADHLFFRRKKKKLRASEGFWKTVFLIEIFDLAFAIDSIVAGVAFISSEDPSSFHQKIWIVYVGGIIGLLGIRYLAHMCSLFLNRFPKMEQSAHLMIGWIGIKLIYALFPHPPFFEAIFWVGLAILFALGLVKKKASYGR